MRDVAIPVCNVEDPASLEAWYGNFGFFDHYRKVVLSNCREIVRAEYVLSNEKITESRLDDLSREHPKYLAFLAEHLDGREKREDNVRSSFAR